MKRYAAFVPALIAFSPLIIAVPLLIVAAFVQGKMTERWTKFPELATAAARLDKVPLRIGDWVGTLGPKLDPLTRKYAGSVGDLDINYVNVRTHYSVRLFVMCARVMDVYKHVPDKCYPAQGFKMQSDPQQVKVTLASDESATFLTTTFSKPPYPDRRIFWTWASSESADGWHAPKEGEDLREILAGDRAVFKVYFEGDVLNQEQTTGSSPSADLIRQLLPELTKVLCVPPPGAGAESARSATAESSLGKSQIDKPNGDKPSAAKPNVGSGKSSS